MSRQEALNYMRTKESWAANLQRLLQSFKISNQHLSTSDRMAAALNHLQLLSLSLSLSLPPFSTYLSSTCTISMIFFPPVCHIPGVLPSQSPSLARPLSLSVCLSVSLCFWLSCILYYVGHILACSLSLTSISDCVNFLSVCLSLYMYLSLSLSVYLSVSLPVVPLVLCLYVFQSSLSQPKEISSYMCFRNKHQFLT